MLTKNSHLCLVDGSGYIFRAYHALPPLTRKQDGLPIGAVAGFCNMLYKFLCDIKATNLQPRPTHLAIVFDHSSETFRKKLYPEYKAHRPKPPEDLIVQFTIIRQAVEAFNIVSIEQAGMEADDIIASCACQAAKLGAKVTIVSSDKDIAQLVNDNISMYDAAKDKTILPADIEAKWGVKPSQMIDMQALIGDASDNVPGVKGVGVKTAASLLNAFGELDNIYANLAQISSASVVKKLELGRENAFLSKKLVTLKQDVELAQNLDDFAVQAWHDSQLIGFLKALGLNNLCRRIAKHNDIALQEIEPAELDFNWQAPAALAAEDPGVSPAENGAETPLGLAQHLQKNYSGLLVQSVIFSTPPEVEQLLQKLAHGLECALYFTEIAVYISYNAESCYSFAYEDCDLQQLQNLLEDEAVLKIFYDLKTQLGLIEEKLGHNVNLQSYDDIMLMAYVLNTGAKLGLDNLSARFLDKSEVPAATMFYRLHKVLRPLMVAQQQNHIYEELEKPMIKLLYAMQNNGIMIDKSLLLDLSIQFAGIAAELEADIYKLAGEEFNIGSPKQMGIILFDKLAIKTAKNAAKKTKSGQFSTDIKVLEELAANGYEIAGLIAQWRQITKLKSTYSDALPKCADQYERVHTNYILAGTNTARLASAEPNLQNIPIRTSQGRKIRQAFIAPKGKVLVSADYNQIELRLLAHIANVAPLREAFARGDDIHAITAAEIFNTALADVTPQLRRQAKAINFGIIYGISAFGLAQQLQISALEAQNYINAYLEKFSAIKDYMQQTREFVQNNGFVVNIFGRKILYSNLATVAGKDMRGAADKVKGPQKAMLERAAINARIQSSAADIIRRAMIQIPSALAQANCSAKMLLQVHDELVFEVEKDQLEDCTNIICQVMEEAHRPVIELSLPLKVEVGFGKNWDSAH